MLVLGLAVACAVPTPTPPLRPAVAPTNTPAAPTTAPVRASFPYSFEQANLRIGLLGIGRFTSYGRTARTGYRVMAVNVRFDNLSNRSNSASCVGFAALQVKTDEGNIYGMSDGGYDLGGSIRPLPVRSQATS
ncbi:MAG TPA: hypothetical protein VG370_03010 [Chloroflexota bacterium]|jgi:hypothetical protein|nr:hypothetical protein [Chloroflexota bacterium]